jgi:uncharacterized protein (DUF433 family)
VIDWSSCSAVERDPGFVSGDWVFVGTRVPVLYLFESLATGASTSEVLQWHPGVTLDHIRDVMRHVEKSTGGQTTGKLDDEAITVKLNEIYAVQDSKIHPAFVQAQYERMSRELWDERIYHHLVIEAASSETEIWFADDDGYLVQKATGVLDTHVVAGDYVVEFGLRTTVYPVRLVADARHTEQDIRTWSRCPRPVPGATEPSCR